MFLLQNEINLIESNMQLELIKLKLKLQINSMFQETSYVNNFCQIFIKSKSKTQERYQYNETMSIMKLCRLNMLTFRNKDFRNKSSGK